MEEDLSLGGYKDIKDCPFCGSGYHSLQNNGLEKRGFQSYAIICGHCHASTGSYTHKYQAIDSWNKRI
jgi:Lar family restriction alleviation protein